MTESWVTAQQKAYTGWINAHLAHANTKIRSLSDLSSGVKLIELLEVLENRKLRQFRSNNRAPRQKYDQLETIQLVLRHIEGKSKGKGGTKLAQELINSGEEKTLLSLAWRLVLTYGVAADVSVDDQRKYTGTPEEMLKQWCNDKLPEGVKIRNFTTSFQKGEIFAMLFNHALKDEEQIQEDDMVDLSPHELLDAVFDIAEAQLAIPRLIDVQDLLEAPDKFSVMTYVSLIRSSVHAAEKTRNQVQNSMDKMQTMFNTLETQLQDRIGFLERTLETTVKSNQAAEAAKLREKERREESEQEFRQKIALVSAERNNLQAECESLRAMVSQLQSEKAAETKRVQEKDEQLRVSEMRVQEMMTNSVNNDVVVSLNEENQRLKERVEEVSAESIEKEKQMESVFQDIKVKLQRSNAAGKEYRDRVRDLETEMAHQKSTQLDNANQQAAKDAELEDYRAYVKELREQLGNQEVVFKLQLQEMGHLIDEMREREKQNASRYQKMIEEMQEEHSIQLAHSLQEQEEREAANRRNQQMKQPSMHNIPDRKQSVNDQIANWKPATQNQWEKTIQSDKTKWGHKKLITSWKFVVDGTDQHEVALSHNTYHSGGKSKRVLTVNGAEKYNDKSDTSTFYFSVGHHTCQVFIRENKEPTNPHEWDYDLYVDKMPFEDLRREFYIEMQRQRAAEVKYGKH